MVDPVGRWVFHRQHRLCFTLEWLQRSPNICSDSLHNESFNPSGRVLAPRLQRTLRCFLTGFRQLRLRVFAGGLDCVDLVGETVIVSAVDLQVRVTVALQGFDL